jgi:glycosyltransferase involved in cell wall biosynthesis
MKICYLCPDLGISVDGHKGASSHIRGFVNALKRHGHDVMIVTPNSVAEGTIDAPIVVIPQPELLDGILQEEDPRTFRALRHAFYNCSIEQLLKEIVNVHKPDLVYERYSPFSFAGGVFCRKRQIPHILEVNAPLAEQGKLYRKQSLQEASELLEKSAFAQAGMIITLTDELKNWLISLGIAEEKIRVRPCGVDETMFNPVGDSYKDRFKGKMVLGFVGSLKPWHDIALLSEIFQKLTFDPKYHLLVVGDGPMRNTINALSEKFPGRVTCSGAVDQEEVPKYIRAMDITLAPYPRMDLFYFSPLKVYEYMAMGKAVIATGIGQINQLIKNNVNGCLVPVGDIEAWVNTIKSLALDHSLREKLGKAAVKEINQNHTWDKRAEAFEKMLAKQRYKVDYAYEER